MQKTQNNSSKVRLNLEQIRSKTSFKKTVEREFTNITSYFNQKMAENKEISYTNLLSESINVLKSKLKARLEGLKKIKPAHSNIELPSKFRVFLFDVTRWIETALLSTEDISDQEFFKEFKLSESGDIFKGESQKNIANGRGICITSK